MVDNVNNGPTGHMYLKLKGKDSSGNSVKDRSIDINADSLKNLRKTSKNQALFAKYDSNNDGKIDEKEALAIRNNLQSIAGNGTLSQREIDSTFGKGTFESLLSLQEQQDKLKRGQVYQEKDGNTTTSVRIRHGKSVIEKRIDLGNGSYKEVFEDGRQMTYDTTGRLTEIEHPDGSKTLSPDKNTVIELNKDGNLTSVMEHKDNRTIQKTYDGSGSSTPTSVSATWNDKSSDPPAVMIAEYDTSDVELKKPLKETRNKGLPTETVTTYTYEQNGNIRFETKNSAGEVVSTNYTDSDGNHIDETPKKPAISRELFSQFGNRVTVDEAGSSQRLTKNTNWQTSVSLPRSWNGEGAPSQISIALPGDYGDIGVDGVAQRRYQTLKLVDPKNNVYQDKAGLRSFQLDAGDDGITLKQVHYENGLVSELSADDSRRVKSKLNEWTAEIETRAAEQGQGVKGTAVGADERVSHGKTIIKIDTYEDAQNLVDSLSNRNNAWGTYTAIGSNRGSLHEDYGPIEYLSDNYLPSADGTKKRLTYDQIKPALTGLMSRVPEKFRNDPDFLYAQKLIQEADHSGNLKARALDKTFIKLAQKMDIQGTNHMPNEYLRSGNGKVQITPDTTATSYWETDAKFSIPTASGGVKNFFFYRDDALYDKCYDFQDIVGSDKNGKKGLISNDSTGNNRKGEISFNAKMLDPNERYYFQTSGGRELTVIVENGQGYVTDKSGNKIAINDILNGRVPMPD